MVETVASWFGTLIYSRWRHRMPPKKEQPLYESKEQTPAGETGAVTGKDFGVRVGYVGKEGADLDGFPEEFGEPGTTVKECLRDIHFLKTYVASLRAQLKRRLEELQQVRSLIDSLRDQCGEQAVELATKTTKLEFREQQLRRLSSISWLRNVPQVVGGALIGLAPYLDAKIATGYTSLAVVVLGGLLIAVPFAVSGPLTSTKSRTRP
jgi:hypothetical protein